MIDHTGHKYGPHSAELDQQLMKLDERFDHLVTQLETSHLQDEVDILIFSDHGMTDVSSSRVVNISGHVDMADVEVMLGSGSLVYIWPKNEKQEKVFNIFNVSRALLTIAGNQLVLLSKFQP